MRKTLFAIICTFFFACQSDKKGEQSKDSATVARSANADTLTFNYDSIKVYSKAPLSTDKRVTDTSKAVIMYPVFQDSILNKFLEQQVCKAANNNPDLHYSTYKELATDFIARYDDFRKNNDDNIQTWFLDAQLYVLLQKPGYISLRLDNVDYAGGAHANPTFVYINYDLNRHQSIPLDSLLKTGSRPKLEAIAERIFRKNEGLSPTQSFENTYFFENGKFRLNENYTLTRQGIEFLYNPYEIKSYAEGITKLLIPYAEIKDLTRPNSIISRFQ
jgi:hypothetical protein